MFWRRKNKKKIYPPPEPSGTSVTTPSALKRDTLYRERCTKCGSPAYVGFNVHIECTNPLCEHYADN